MKFVKKNHRPQFCTLKMRKLRLFLLSIKQGKFQYRLLSSFFVEIKMNVKIVVNVVAKTVAKIVVNIIVNIVVKIVVKIVLVVIASPSSPIVSIFDTFLLLP